MCMRSPSLPKYSISVSGKTFASARMIALPWRHCRNSRRERSMSYLLDRRLDLRAFGGNHEGDGIHPEAGHAELNPEAHDLEDLGLDVWVRRVEIGLEVIEAMKEPGLGFLVMRPCRFLHPGKDHALAGAGGSLVGPDVPIAMLRIRRASCVSKPR